MKQLTLSDSDYALLMELSKELQTQPNHYQAFPYFWEPRSKIEKLDFNGEGDIVRIAYDGESYYPKDLFEEFDEIRLEFLENSDLDTESEFESINESDFIDWINGDDRFRILTYNLEYQTEHNPSLFLSDVNGFIKRNRHHLGEEPSTYARTIWRMPKMEALVRLIYGINKEHGEEINHECKRYIQNQEKQP